MTKWLRIIILCQILFFIAWAGYEIHVTKPVTEILLETAPVDPRDLFAGKYLQLSLRISNLRNVAGYNLFSSKAPVAIKLTPQKTVLVNNKPTQVWGTESVVTSFPDPFPAPTNDVIWIKVKSYNNWSGALFGVERYYFSEARQTEIDRLVREHLGRPMYILVTVSANGNLRLKDLIW